MKNLTREDVVKIILEEFPDLKRQKSNEETQSAKEKTKKELFFEQYDKIADVKLRELCKERYDDSFRSTIHSNIRNSIYHGFNWGKSKEGTEWWLEIYKRTDLETNPYIISDWEVEKGETYYTPNIINDSLYSKIVNVGIIDSHSFAQALKEKNLLHRTPEEAIAMSKEILEFVKQRKK